MDKYRIDGHKLMYHVDRLDAWRQGQDIYPIYLEISPAGGCNHRCTFCALDFMAYQGRFLDTQILKDRLGEMAQLGVKSVMYAGEGEPLLHRDIGEIVQHTKQAGIDVAVTTNGVMLDEERAAAILPHVQWCKVSINAGTAAVYSKIHRSKESDFEKVICNMRRAAKMKEAVGSDCCLGMQMVLLPENYNECPTLAQLAREVGMSYLVIKPYSHNTRSKTQQYAELQYDDVHLLAEELARFNTETFHVVVRAETIEKWNSRAREYQRCLAMPFWSYIDAGGNVWACSAYLGNKRFRYGSIYEKSFEEIWKGEQRQQFLQWAADELEVSGCRVNCRMDKINSYLWELTHPPEHVNFI